MLCPEKALLHRFPLHQQPILLVFLLDEDLHVHQGRHRRIFVDPLLVISVAIYIIQKKHLLFVTLTWRKTSQVL